VLGEVEVLAAVVDGCERLAYGGELRAIRAVRLLVEHHPDAEGQERRVERRERAVMRSRAGERAADVADLGRHERRARAGAGGRDEGVDCLGRELAEHHPLAGVRHRLRRVHVQLGDPDRRHHRERVHRRAELAQRLQQLGAFALVAEHDRLDDHELTAAKRLRDVRDGRELEDATNRRDLVRDGGRPGMPRVENLGGALPREEEDARVDLGNRVQLELERGDDPEVPAAAAKRPEELGVVLVVDCPEPAVRGHQLDRGDAVRGEPELARVPADAAAERVARDADVRRGACSAARPRSDACGTSAPHFAPERTRATRSFTSIATPCSRSVFTRITPPSAPSGSALCPVRCGASCRPVCHANSTSVRTSSASAGSATIVGCCVKARLNACVAAAHSGPPGSTIVPRKRRRRPLREVEALVWMAVTKTPWSCLGCTHRLGCPRDLHNPAYS
jgi:hypothetical protein